MFFTGFDSLMDVLTCHYVFAVVISLLAVSVSLLLSFVKKTEKQTNASSLGSGASRSDETEVDDDDDDDESHVENVDLTKSDMKRGLKNSPALMAEMVIKASMTEEQKKMEQEVRKQQLAEIYKLMQKEKEKFGDVSVEQVEEQMKLYQ